MEGGGVGPAWFLLAFVARQGTVNVGTAAGSSGAGMSISRPEWLSWKRATVAAVLLVVVTVGYFYANPGIDPVQAPEIERILGQLRPTLSEGWKATAARDVITVRKTDSVAVFYDISLPGGITRERLKEFTRTEQLAITVKVCTRVEPEEYQRRVEINQETDLAIKAFEKNKLRALPRTKPNDDDDPWSHYNPKTPTDQALIAEFKAFIKSLPNYEMPNYYSDQHSYHVGSSLKVMYFLYESDEEAEYMATWDKITSLFRPHSNAQPPYRYWDRGGNGQ